MTDETKLKLSDTQGVYFRDKLRDARYAVLRDSEAFDEVLFALERLGVFLFGEKVATLSCYQANLNDLSKKSCLSKDIPKKFNMYHIPFHKLYEMVMSARNDALHQGAIARHLARHAIELSLILEDALMSEANKVCHFMVRDVVCAEEWQPLSFIRQNMLTNSFSYLPVCVDGKWKIISDYAIASYLRSVNSEERKERLAKRLSESVKDDLEKAETCDENTDVSAILDKLRKNTGKPILVISDKKLVGILTSFDLL